MLMILAVPVGGQEGLTLPTTKVEPAEAILGKLSLKQKVGQLLILGYSGTSYQMSLQRVLPTFEPGALIAFGRNIKSMRQISELNRQAQLHALKLNGLPLFIMVDQEGGSVARVKTRPPMPSALAMGMTGDDELATRMGHLMGHLLATLGFNFNLAPVLDIGDPNRPNFIGNRAFGGEPQMVSRMATSFSAGLAEAKIVPTAKHFPGHGGLVQDSHKTTPRKLLSLEELEATDLVPFKRFSELPFPSSIMVAHVAYPNIDDSGLPAAFSPVIITDILREKLGYQGLVITDDIEMLGAGGAGGVGERAVKAVEAGCDMVMVAWSPHRQRDAFRALVQAVEDGRITEERLNSSVLRIIRAKLKFDKPGPQLAAPEFKVKLNSHLSALREVTRKVHRLNFIRSSNELIQLNNDVSETQSFLVFTSDPAFFKSFKDGTKNPAKFMRLTPRSIKDVEGLLAGSPDALGIYYASGTATARKLNSIPRNLAARMYIVNATYPGAIENPDRFRAVIQLNSLEPTSGQWLAEALLNRPSATPDLTGPPEGLRVPTATPVPDSEPGDSN